MAAYQQRRGVVLTLYHAFASRFVFPWVAGTGIKPVLLSRPAREVAQAIGQPYLPAMEPFLNAQQLHAAKACLAQAGVLHIAQDEVPGQKWVIHRPFLQRIRPFRTSFAELALLTGALVLPVSATLDLRGRVEITFHPPLAAGNEQQPREERIEQLLTQYLAFLHTQWVRMPGNLTFNLIKTYLDPWLPS